MFPLYIWNLALSITNVCNLRCKHCYAMSGAALPNEMSYDTIKDILIPQVKNANVKFITLTGGEPFCHPKILDIISEIRKAGIKVSIATNGTKINEELLSSLKRLGVSRIQISLEGSTAQLNDIVRGKGVYDKILSIMPKIVESGIHTAISFTPTTHNYTDIKKMSDLCLELGVNTLSVRRYSNSGRAMTNHLEATKLKNKELLTQICNLRKDSSYSKLNILTGDPLIALIDDKYKAFTDNVLAGCTAGISSLAIDSEGNIKPCTRADIVCGNIIKNDLCDIWENNILLNQLRDRNNLRGKCETCKVKMVCGGCRACALQSSGSIFGEDSSCWL